MPGSWTWVRRVLPWVMAVLAAASAGGSQWIQMSITGEATGSLFNGLFSWLGLLAFSIVGALIVARRDGHPVGWVLCGVGLAFGAHDLAATYGLAGTPRGWPAAASAAWYGHAGFVTWFLLAFVLLPLVYPEGRLPSRRWRWLLWMAGALLVVSVVNSLARGSISPEGREEIANPLRIELLGPLEDPTEFALQLLFFPVMFAAIAALVVRYRRSAGVERQQMKWFLAAAAVVPFGFAASAIPAIARFTQHLGGPLLLALPVAIGMAILRHRLYEIDRIVSRTVTYGTVTALLVAVYALGVVSLGALVRTVTGGGGGELVVAASTLLVAAVFRPVRDHVQGVVDRRFDRTRYDAQRTVEAFTQRLRDEVHLEVLRSDLVAIATATVGPSHASAWLVDETGAPRRP